jgi:hypothetical protein
VKNFNFNRIWGSAKTQFLQEKLKKLQKNLLLR